MPVVRGRVLDVNGVPVAGAAVFFVSAPAALPDIAAMTDSHGAFALSAPVAGHYVVGVRHGESAAEAGISVPADRDVSLELRLGPLPGR
jgi:Carboxypeptidase regulatory-like domain